jgi:uracil-DNA glycosylase
MRSARAAFDVDVWRDEARALLADGVPPADVAWTPDGGTGLLFGASTSTSTSTARVPRRFVTLAERAVLHRDPTHALLYRVLWRITHGEPALLDDAADSEIRELTVRAQSVRRDIHKMHAFVRFKQVGERLDQQVDDQADAPSNTPTLAHDEAGAHFVAWYQPHHRVLRAAAPFFAERFASMRWSILTPDESVAWTGDRLEYFAGVPRHAAPEPDELEDLWRTYYASIFNPARVNTRVMRQHMPARFWPQLPEAAIISDLVSRATPRVDTMLARVPEQRSLPVLREAARSCTACELCGPATQTVFGEGPPDARIVLVGEQPGDQEDLAGRPFIGPAGAVLDAALARAGIDRDTVYVTNAVKHFRFLPRGKKRLHQRPTADQIRACKPWVVAELQAIAPRVIVCLGATAAQSLIGSRFSVSRQRGEIVSTPWADALLATHHPAAVLRVDPADRPRYEAELAEDLMTAVRSGFSPP